MTGRFRIGPSSHAGGDIWIADGSGDQLLHFPGGRIRDGQIVKVAGLKSPFDVVIDGSRTPMSVAADQLTDNDLTTIVRYLKGDYLPTPNAPSARGSGSV